LSVVITPSKPGVYEIKNINTGMIYVGASKDPRSRWKTHIAASKRADDLNNYFYNSLRKYGSDSFVFTIAKEFDTSFEAFQYENIRMIELRESGHTLYNKRPGGNGHFVMTDKMKLERSERLLGTKLNEEIKEKISNSLKGRVLSEEHKENIGKSLNAPEVILKRSLARKNVKLNKKTKEKISNSLKLAYKNKTKIAEHSGENNPRSILNENDVKEIRNLWNSFIQTSSLKRGEKGKYYTELAIKYNVSSSNICRLITGRTWKNI
jgi:group I intron endonuclease